MSNILELLDHLDDTFSASQNEGEAQAPIDATGSSQQVGTDSSQDEWISNDKSRKVGKRPPELWDTAVKKVERNRLIWSKCAWLTGGKNSLPGRICDNSEGSCEPGITWPIADDQLLVEFIRAPKENPIVPRMAVVKKIDTAPYNAPLKKSKINQLWGGKSDTKLPIAWDSGYMTQLEEKLRNRYGQSIGTSLLNKMKERADEFLRLSYDLKEISLKQGEAEEGEDLSLKDDSYYEGSEHNSDQESTVSLAELAKITSEASAKKVGMAKTIKPGDWISYQSKIFKDKRQFSRVICVTGDKKYPIDLENDDVLDRGDTVRLLESDGKDGYIPNSGVSRLLGEFKFRKGKIDVLSLDEQLRRDTLKSLRKAERETGFALNYRPNRTEESARKLAQQQRDEADPPPTAKKGKGSEKKGGGKGLECCTSRDGSTPGSANDITRSGGSGDSSGREKSALRGGGSGDDSDDDDDDDDDFVSAPGPGLKSGKPQAVKRLSFSAAATSAAVDGNGNGNGGGGSASAVKTKKPKPDLKTPAKKGSTLAGGVWEEQKQVAKTPSDVPAAVKRSASKATTLSSSSSAKKSKSTTSVQPEDVGGDDGKANPSSTVQGEESSTARKGRRGKDQRQDNDDARSSLAGSQTEKEQPPPPRPRPQQGDEPVTQRRRVPVSNGGGSQSSQESSQLSLRSQNTEKSDAISQSHALPESQESKASQGSSQSSDWMETTRPPSRSARKTSAGAMAQNGATGEEDGSGGKRKSVGASTNAETTRATKTPSRTPGKTLGKTPGKITSKTPLTEVSKVVHTTTADNKVKSANIPKSSKKTPREHDAASEAAAKRRKNVGAVGFTT